MISDARRYCTYAWSSWFSSRSVLALSIASCAVRVKVLSYIQSATPLQRIYFSPHATPPTGVLSVTSNAAAWSCRSLIFGNLGGGRLPAGDGLLPFGYDPGRLIPPTPPREWLPFDHGAKSGGEGSVAASGGIISLNPDPLTASSSLKFRIPSVLRAP